MASVYIYAKHITRVKDSEKDAKNPNSLTSMQHLESVAQTREKVAQYFGFVKQMCQKKLLQKAIFATLKNLKK